MSLLAALAAACAGTLDESLRAAALAGDAGPDAPRALADASRPPADPPRDAGAANPPTDATPASDGEAAAPDAAATAAVRVAAGASAPYTDPDGNVWSADTGFTGGGAGATVPPVSIAGTNASPLYNDERYGGTATVPASFTYAFTLPGGSYQVTLKFADTDVDAPGKRQFDVAINGQSVLTDFDIVAAAGGKDIAVDKTFPASVGPDGALTIAFTPGAAYNPKVCALEITRAP